MHWLHSLNNDFLSCQLLVVFPYMPISLKVLFKYFISNFLSSLKVPVNTFRSIINFIKSLHNLLNIHKPPQSTYPYYHTNNQLQSSPAVNHLQFWLYCSVKHCTSNLASVSLSASFFKHHPSNPGFHYLKILHFPHNQSKVPLLSFNEGNSSPNFMSTSYSCQQNKNIVTHSKD